MNFLQKYRTLLVLTFFAGIFHFYNLNWGAPYYFHPDERNIASSVSQLNFPNHMHPNFFAYGAFPIYTIYLTSVLHNYLMNTPTTVVTFGQAIIVSRFFSAIFATLLIPLLFVIGKKLKDEKTGIVAAFLGTTSVGLIQFAHFGTFELWLTFFSTLLFWFCLKVLDHSATKFIVILGIIAGILVSTKISHLALLPLPVLAICMHHFFRSTHTHRRANILRGLRSLVLFVLLVIFVYMLSNPYVFFDTQGFLASMKYESSVALGTLPVFYTGEFFGTIPVLFQLIHVYPFLLNPFLTIIFSASLVYLCIVAVKKKSVLYFFLIISFLILFLSQAFLFVKWTRYMVPTLPFIYLICAIATIDCMKLLAKKSLLSANILRGVLILIHIVFATSYLITAYVQKDTRLVAEAFSQKMIPHSSPVLSEVYDLGITAFSHPSITLFNFYELENTDPKSTVTALNTQLINAEYLILPSARVLKTRIQNKERFPAGHNIYTKLTTEQLGFKKIYETPCDIFCNITYLGSPVFSFEGTANVFDRPTVIIYKKL